MYRICHEYASNDKHEIGVGWHRTEGGLGLLYGHQPKVLPRSSTNKGIRGWLVQERAYFSIDGATCNGISMARLARDCPIFLG